MQALRPERRADQSASSCWGRVRLWEDARADIEDEETRESSLVGGELC